MQTRLPNRAPHGTTTTMMRVFILGALLVVIGAGCKSYVVVPDGERAALESRYQGQVLWLKQSLFVGQFYDDNRYRLVHPRPFEELTYLKTIEGEAIPPPPADGVVPAGTRVRLERIEWPTGQAVFRRPLFTPRYTTWVFLRVARDRGDVTLTQSTPHILLLPAGIRDEATFAAWLDTALVKDDPNPWLRSLPQDQQNGIALKQAVRGMSYDAVVAALGFPDRVAREDRADADGDRIATEVAHYGPLQVVLQQNVVVEVRKAQKPSAPKASLTRVESARLAQAH